MELRRIVRLETLRMNRTTRRTSYRLESECLSQCELYLEVGTLPKFDLMMIKDTGSHFSCKHPISQLGLNTVDCKVGLVYNFNRRADELVQSWQRPIVPPFPRHVSYDLTLFGSWRKSSGP